MSHLTEEDCNCLSNTTEGRIALKVIVDLEERVAFAEEAKANAEAKLVEDTASIREKNKRIGGMLGKVTSAARRFYAQKGSLKSVMEAIRTVLTEQGVPSGPFPTTMVFFPSPPGRSMWEHMELFPAMDKHLPRDFAQELALAINVDKSHAQAVLDGTADLTPKMAEKFVACYGAMDVGFWKRRQDLYTISRAVHGVEE